MGPSAIARRIGPLAAITTLASLTAFGVGSPWAGAAGLAPDDRTDSIPIGANLAGVSCPTSSMCMIVGNADGVDGDVPAAATWNGKSWRWMTQPPEPEPNSALIAVTCLSATSCIAIGDTDATVVTRKAFAFADEWNGATWRALPPMAGVPFNDAMGLSCVTASYCLAVGGFRLPYQPGSAIAELWNGASWTELTPIIPAGVNDVDFASVSCLSKSDCQAVGSYNTMGSDFSLAESWNGSTWTMQAAPQDVTEFDAVSCPRPKLCLAGGTGSNGLPAVALWNGATWHTLTTPDLTGFANTLTGVSCASATHCLVVGGSIAAAWTGGTSLKRLPIPSQAAGFLFSISCARSSSCLAVGDPEFGGNVAIAWNGSRWRGIRENKSDALGAVSCVTSSDCIAAGSYVNQSDQTAALAQSWGGGTSWRLVSPHHLLGGFAGLSCVGRSFCMATNVHLSATWNGSRWKTTRATAGTTVSCATPRFCAAIGADYRTDVSVWNGARWRVGQMVSPGGVTDSALTGVSCTTPSFCVAVGWYTYGRFGEPFTLLANIWNGKRWRLAKTPAPGRDSILYAISCLRRSGCMAVGAYGNASSTGHNLAMRFGKGKWRVMKMPGGLNIPGLQGPTSVSCSAASSCLAVGSYPVTQIQGREVAEVWNGKAWRLTKPAGPASGLDSVSCARPTFCMAVGQDGNLQLTERWNGHAWRLLRESNP